MISVTTPNKINENVSSLIELIPGAEDAIFLEVNPEQGSKILDCFENVKKKIDRSYGEMLCGWVIWEWKGVLEEAEYHAVWRSPQGKILDITPQSDGEKKVLFVPCPKDIYDGIRKDNIRLAVRDDMIVHHFILLCEEIFKKQSAIEGGAIYSCANNKSKEIVPLMKAREFMKNSIFSGLRANKPCLCGSQKIYSQCHGRKIEGAS